jgi:hypothetical protein
MRLFLLSSNGIGAGKTFNSHFFAGKTGQVLALADEIRKELLHIYPNYPWFAKDQEAKNMIIKETNKTLRQMLVERGQQRCAEDPDYWCKSTANQIDILCRAREEIAIHDEAEVEDFAIAIDDIRKVSEVEFFKNRFPDEARHYHLIYETAKQEDAFLDQYIPLEAMSDLILIRK